MDSRSSEYACKVTSAVLDLNKKQHESECNQAFDSRSDFLNLAIYFKHLSTTLELTHLLNKSVMETLNPSP